MDTNYGLVLEKPIAEDQSSSSSGWNSIFFNLHGISDNSAFYTFHHRIFVSHFYVDFKHILIPEKNIFNGEWKIVS